MCPAQLSRRTTHSASPILCCTALTTPNSFGNHVPSPPFSSIKHQPRSWRRFNTAQNRRYFSLCKFQNHVANDPLHFSLHPFSLFSTPNFTLFSSLCSHRQHNTQATSPPPLPLAAPPALLLLLLLCYIPSSHIMAHSIGQPFQVPAKTKTQSAIHISKATQFQTCNSNHPSNSRNQALGPQITPPQPRPPSVSITDAATYSFPAWVSAIPDHGPLIPAAQQFFAASAHSETHASVACLLHVIADPTTSSPCSSLPRNQTGVPSEATDPSYGRRRSQALSSSFSLTTGTFTLAIKLSNPSSANSRTTPPATQHIKHTINTSDPPISSPCSPSLLHLSSKNSHPPTMVFNLGLTDLGLGGLRRENHP